MSTLVHERRMRRRLASPTVLFRPAICNRSLRPGGPGADVASDPHVACGYERQRIEPNHQEEVGCQIDRATTIAAEMSASAMGHTRAGAVPPAAPPHARAAIGDSPRWIARSRKRSRAKVEKRRMRKAPRMN